MKIIFKENSWLFLLLTPLVLLFGIGNYFFSYFQELNVLEARIEQTHLKALQYKKKKQQEEKILLSLAKTGKALSEKDLENTLFLEPEIKKLQLLAQQEESSKKRLRFLSEGSNSLKFQQEKNRLSEQLKETELKQKYPVEMNDKDLKKILNVIEQSDALASSSQFIIKKFELAKKDIPLEGETVYLIQFDLIKRELSK